MPKQYSRRTILGALPALVGAACAPSQAVPPPSTPEGTPGLSAQANSAVAPPPRNVVLITADDMDYRSVGSFGCGVPAITQNIDGLAAEGILFARAHVNIAVCQPSRQTLMTGRYPHRFGALGFQPIHASIPTLAESLHQAGYINGILGKTRHLQPTSKFHWSLSVPEEDLGHGRDPAKYGTYAAQFFQQAGAAGRPFFLMANSHDPHRPFAGSQSEESAFKRRDYPLNQRYTERDIELPGFLPDLPNIRKELAQYFSSVHRADETTGAVLQALDAAGLRDDTLVVFLSDHGMSFPFAKSNCYLSSTRTPLILRYPRSIAAGRTDTTHFVSSIDFMPTVLEMLGLPAVPGVDGQSFLPLLQGQDQPGRDRIFAQYHETSSGRHYPMRCIQEARYSYIWNAWSDGTTKYESEAMSGLTWKAMKAAAKHDPVVRKRVELYSKRVPEELYDTASDPFALQNLVATERGELARLRQELLTYMEQTSDPLAAQFLAHMNRAS